MENEEKLSSGGVDATALVELLAEGFCGRCRRLLETRLQNPDIIESLKSLSLSNGKESEGSGLELCSPEKSSASSSTNISQKTKSPLWGSRQTPIRSNGNSASHSSPASVGSRVPSVGHSPRSEAVVNDDSGDMLVSGNGSSGEPRGVDLDQRERVRLSQVGRKKDFVYMERVEGRQVNVLKGLELHTRVFNAAEQKKIVDYVYDLQKQGQAKKLKGRTYSEPKKWMRGKGRVTLQFGCCYNYALDRDGNPPGIIRDESVDPLPPLLKLMIRRLVGWSVLPPTCVPDSCIINIYDEGDCIPPHVDHHDFVRPFCTVSFLTECKILFGQNLKSEGPGEFSGPVSIPLPVGSVLVLSGNGADIAKHCVPAVPTKRISITFRKMDDTKLPYRFKRDPDLEGLQPLHLRPQQTYQNNLQVNGNAQQAPSPQQTYQNNQVNGNRSAERASSSSSSPVSLGQDDFPPLGSSNKVNRRRF